MEERIWNLLKNSGADVFYFSLGMKSKILLHYLLKLREKYNFDFRVKTFTCNGIKWLKEEYEYIMKANDIKYKRITVKCNKNPECAVWDAILNENENKIMACAIESYFYNLDEVKLFYRKNNIIPVFFNLGIKRDFLIKEYEKIRKTCISSAYHCCFFCNSCPSQNNYIIYNNAPKEVLLYEFQNALLNKDIEKMLNLVKIYNNKYFRELDDLYAEYIKTKDELIKYKLISECINHIRW